MALADLANPTRFLAFSGRILPALWALAALLLALGLYLSFFVAPADYQQGEMVRIMFIHVPAAWLGMACYGFMAVAALGTLVWRHPLADVAQKSAAPIGAAFTFLALVTGALWGKPTWGTYWVWDARLTSMLILFLMYLGLIALWQAVEDSGRAGADRRDPRRWSARSTCRSSNSRSTGGTRCIRARASSAPTARPSPRACCGRSSSWSSP